MPLLRYPHGMLMFEKITTWHNCWNQVCFQTQHAHHWILQADAPMYSHFMNIWLTWWFDFWPIFDWLCHSKFLQVSVNKSLLHLVQLAKNLFDSVRNQIVPSTIHKTAVNHMLSPQLPHHVGTDFTIYMWPSLSDCTSGTHPLDFQNTRKSYPSTAFSTNPPSYLTSLHCSPSLFHLSFSSISSLLIPHATSLPST